VIAELEADHERRDVELGRQVVAHVHGIRDRLPVQAEVAAKLASELVALLS
jgi:hypothetical protein